MITGFIFDMDGVLVDSMDAHFHAWQKFLKKHKCIKFTRKIFNTYIAIQTTEMIEIYNKKYNLGIADIDAGAKEKESMINLSEYKSYPDVKSFLRKVHNNKFKLSIATSALKRDMVKVISKFSLEKYFDAIATASEVKHAKPNPAIFLKAAKKLKLKPKNCVVIEDAFLGVRAAKAAGMKCIALTTTYPRNILKKEKPDLIVNHLSDIDIEKVRIW